LFLLDNIVFSRIQEERDRRHSQKHREKDGKTNRFQAPPPPSASVHSDLARKDPFFFLHTFI
jgi:hypothetical protein